MAKTEQAQIKDEKQEKQHIEKSILYLQENLDTPKNTRMDVNHLWGKCYRVNFWGKKKIKHKKREVETIAMIDSKFIMVDKVADGLTHRIIG